MSASTQSSPSKNKGGVVNIRKQFRKTKMCSYQSAGRCTFGAQCFYAHCTDELSSAPDLRKTKLCSSFQDGECKHSTTCTYAHGSKELRATDAVYKTVQCQWFATGHCSLGNACRYAHGVEDKNEIKPANGETKKRKNKKKNAAKAPAAAEIPQPAFPSFGATPLPSFDQDSADILKNIVDLCSAIQLGQDMGIPFPPPPAVDMGSPFCTPKYGYGSGYATPSTIASTNTSPATPVASFCTPKYGYGSGYATPSTIASTNTSPLFIPTCDTDIFRSPAFHPAVFPPRKAYAGKGDVSPFRLRSDSE